MKNAKTIMVQGTGSGVGKSVITCALCRIMLQDGYSVAPFKSQNMALNSFVTDEGGEIGRAQATQAMACKIKPSIHINPILIKPTSDTSAQIILHGKPVRNMSVYEYKNYKRTVYGKVKQSLKKLKDEYDVVVIEGAGSPAEVNLKSHDLVNMRIAKLAGAPVILVGDIDKGGVFAWLIGTLELLSKEERGLVKGFIINKFRGDKRLLMSGLRFLENYTGIKVLGVIPYYNDIKISEEDSLPVESRKSAAGSKNKINISVVCLPHMSNFSDFDPLEQESDVVLRYVKNSEELGGPDVIMIPGTKNTIDDMRYLKKSGLAGKIVSACASNRKIRLVGICGGYQMLGTKIYDMGNVESKNKEVEGLDILPIVTRVRDEKVLSQVKGKAAAFGDTVTGYEIHHGRTRICGDARPAFEITEFMGKDAKRPDGAISADGRYWGTYIHGVFDSDKFRRHFLNRIRKDKGWPALESGAFYDEHVQIDKLADLVRKNIDIALLHEIVFSDSGKDKRRVYGRKK